MRERPCGIEGSSFWNLSSKLSIHLRSCFGARMRDALGDACTAQRMRGARSPSGLFGTRLHGTPGTPGAAGELSRWNNSDAA
jgi:hypothetical protein